MSGKRAAPALPSSAVKALKAILNYFWVDEESDYRARTEAEREGHIFEALRTVREWLEAHGGKRAPEVHTEPPQYLTREAPPTSPASKVIRSAADVHEFCSALQHLRYEEFHVLLLNGRHQVMQRVMVSRGTANQASVHPREVFRPALRAAAVSLVLVHNHPGGDPEPSREDISVTRQLVEVGKLHGIKVLDHVVVSKGGYVSLHERGLC